MARRRSSFPAAAGLEPSFADADSVPAEKPGASHETVPTHALKLKRPAESGCQRPIDFDELPTYVGYLVSAHTRPTSLASFEATAGRLSDLDRLGSFGVLTLVARQSRHHGKWLSGPPPSGSDKVDP
jgi:hypothetical protein